MHKPIAQLNKNVVFRNKIGIPTILGRGTPSFRKLLSGNVLRTSIVERVIHRAVVRSQFSHRKTT